MVVEDRQAASPTLADQVSKLYELIAGYHATHMVEIGRELGVWEALTQSPGLTSEELAASLGTDASTPMCFAGRPSPSGCLNGTVAGGGWRRISTRSSATPTRASTSAVRRQGPHAGRQGLRRLCASLPRRAPGPIRNTTRSSCGRSPRGSRRSPASSSISSCRGSPPQRRGSSRVAGCSTLAAVGDGRWCRSPSGSPRPPVSGSTWSPTRSSWPGG